MTAERSSGALYSVCSSLDSSQEPETAHPQTTWPHPLCFPKQEGEVKRRVRLRLRSPPGAWLMVGIVVVTVGTVVALAGYASSIPNPVVGRVGSHSLRMKVLGPIMMGFGLFIFICAGTLLYENRDRENQQRESLENLKKEQRKFRRKKLKECQRKRSECGDVEQGNWGEHSDRPSPLFQQIPPPVPPRVPPRLPPRVPRKVGSELNIVSVRELNTLLPGEGRRWGHEGELSRVVCYKDPPSPTPSSVDSDSCDSSEINYNVHTGSPIHYIYDL